MKFRLENWLFLFVLIVCSSCSDNQNDIAVSSTLASELGVETHDINSSLKLLDTPEMDNSHLNGDVLSLQLINQTGTVVLLNGDFGLRLQLFDNGVWVNVTNSFFYPDTLVELYPNSQSPGGLIVNALPYISDLKTSIEIRIIVSGTMLSTNELVVAYLDFDLHP